MNEPELISIVMPIYNTGIYLTECIESLIGQSYKHFELICVNDCSTDWITIQKLEYYLQIDNRIFVVNLEKNVGAAQARNVGFQYVKGDYTIFLDADDIFDEFFLEKMYYTLKKEKAEFCLCGFSVFKTGYEGQYEKLESYIPLKNDILDRNSEEWLLKVPLSAWNKLYRTDFLKKHHIYFQSLPSSNDVYFSCRSLFCSCKICVLETDKYIHYRTGTDIQISAKRNPLFFYQAIELLKKESDDINYLKQCEALLMHIVLEGFNDVSNEDLNEKIYNIVGEELKKSKLYYKNKILEKCKSYFIQFPYKNGWYKNYHSFDWQIDLLKNEIIQVVEGYTKISLWGNGIRGKAFQRFCKANRINLYGITDRKLQDDDYGNLNEEGYVFRTIADVKQNSDLIIVSSHIIMKELQEMEKSILLNLEEFCPMW